MNSDRVAGLQGLNFFLRAVSERKGGRLSLIEIAKIAAAKDGWRTYQYIQNYEIGDKRALRDISLIAFVNAPGCIEGFFKECDLGDIGQDFLIDGVSKLFSESRPLQFISDFFEKLPRALPKILSSDKLLELSIGQRLHWFSQLLPFEESLVKKIQNSFLSEVKTEGEASALFSALCHFRNEIPENLEGRKLSRWALSKFSGFNCEMVEEELSENSARRLYSVLVDVGKHFEGRVNKELKVLPQCFMKEHRALTLETLLYIKAIESLGGKRVRRDLTPDNLSEECEKSRSELSTLFEKNVGLTASSDLVGRLQNLWGDLTPIFVLVGRLSSNSKWQRSLPILKEAINACVLGNFCEFKYQDEEQLPFRGKILSAWKENPSFLNYFEQRGSDRSKEERFSSAKKIFETNLIDHISESFRGWEREEPLLPEEITKPPRRLEGGKVFRTIADAISEDNHEKLLALCKLSLERAQALRLSKQVRDDIKAIKEALEPPKEKATKGNLIFSVITDDPKLLLTVGDLVDTSSCQNYRTGSVVQTLPGYVVDGNIKAALSFAVSSSELQDYPELLDAIREGHGAYSYSFDAPRLRLNFTLKDGKSIEIPLKKALRRHILRLGSYHENPALLTERGYIQNHGWEKEIEDNLMRLISSFRGNCEAILAPKGTNFPASRNPCGVYSDAMGGVKMEQYTS